MRRAGDDPRTLPGLLRTPERGAPCHTSGDLVAHEPPEPMRAAGCSRTFVLLAEGGVKAMWACGAEVVRPDETAVDVELLRERIPAEHHHHHWHRGRR